MKKHILKYLNTKEKNSYLIFYNKNENNTDKDLGHIYKSTMKLFEELAQNRYLNHTNDKLMKILKFNQQFLVGLQQEFKNKLIENGTTPDEIDEALARYKNYFLDNPEEKPSIQRMVETLEKNNFPSETLETFKEVSSIIDLFNKNDLRNESILASEDEFIKELTEPLNLSTKDLNQIINEPAETYLKTL